MSSLVVTFFSSLHVQCILNNKQLHEPNFLSIVFDHSFYIYPYWVGVICIVKFTSLSHGFHGWLCEQGGEVFVGETSVLLRMVGLGLWLLAVWMSSRVWICGSLKILFRLALGEYGVVFKFVQNMIVLFLLEFVNYLEACMCRCL